VLAARRFGTGDDMAYDDESNRPMLDDWARRNLAGAS
jgi:hypothetical protein